MCELERPQRLTLRGLLVLPRNRNDSHTTTALPLTRTRLTDVLKVRLVLFELRAEVGVVVADGFVDGVERSSLEDDLLTEVTEVDELVGDFVGEELVIVLAVNEAKLLHLPQHLLNLDSLPHERRVLRRRSLLGNDGEDDRSSFGETGDGTDELNEDRLCFEVEDVVLGDVVLSHEGSRDVLNGHLPSRVEGEVDGTVVLARDLGGRRSEFVEEDAEVLLVVSGLQEDV
jgi:hypothetical protein